MKRLSFRARLSLVVADREHVEPALQRDHGPSHDRRLEGEEVNAILRALGLSCLGLGLGIFAGVVYRAFKASRLSR